MTGGSEALGQVDVAAAAEAPGALSRWACVMSGAQTYLDDPGPMGGPPTRSIENRTTLELHTGDVIAEDLYENGKVVPDPSVPTPSLEGRDTLTYFYCKPQEAERLGWKENPPGQPLRFHHLLRPRLHWTCAMPRGEAASGAPARRRQEAIVEEPL